MRADRQGVLVSELYQAKDRWLALLNPVMLLSLKAGRRIHLYSLDDEVATILRYADQRNMVPPSAQTNSSGICMPSKQSR